MKILGLIIGVFLLIAVFPQGVNAQQAWEIDNGTCRNSLYPPKSLTSIIRYEDPNEIVDFLEENNACFNRNDHQISNYREGDREVWYCRPGDTVARNYYKDEDKYYKDNACCPVDAPFWDRGNNYCCPQEIMDYQTGICDATADNITNFGLVQRYLAETDSIDDLNEPVQIGETTYTCPVGGCLVEKDTPSRWILLDFNFTTQSPLTQAQSGDYYCWAQGTTLSGVTSPDGDVLNDLYCSYQKAVDPIILTLVTMNPDINSCEEIKDDAERKNCLECFMKNIDPSNPNAPKAFVYSSIGCVDTRQNEFITRLFQIGFGMLGGFGVLRIMWGSILRQSTDPAKIQEGKDMITSSIWALITLAVTIPLLRFLGINLLQLLPNNFLR